MAQRRRRVARCGALSPPGCKKVLHLGIIHLGIIISCTVCHLDWILKDTNVYTHTHTHTHTKVYGYYGVTPNMARRG